MKATLSFDLNDAHEVLAHKRAISATDAYLALADFANVLRSERKYGEDRWAEVEKKFYECLSSHGVDLNDLE